MHNIDVSLVSLRQYDRYKVVVDVLIYFWCLNIFLASRPIFIVFFLYEESVSVV